MPNQLKSGGLQEKTGIPRRFTAVMHCITTDTPINSPICLFFPVLPARFTWLEDDMDVLTRPAPVFSVPKIPTYRFTTQENQMSYSLKIGRKVIKSGLTREQAIAESKALTDAGEKAPQVLFVNDEMEQQAVAPEQNEVAVVTSTAFAEMALYCIRHGNAISPSKKYTDKDGNEYLNPYHWSGVMQMALKGYDLSANRLQFLRDTYAKVQASVEWRKQRGSSYRILSDDQIDWSVGN